MIKAGPVHVCSWRCPHFRAFNRCTPFIKYINLLDYAGICSPKWTSSKEFWKKETQQVSAEFGYNILWGMYDLIFVHVGCHRVLDYFFVCDRSSRGYTASEGAKIQKFAENGWFLFLYIYFFFFWLEGQMGGERASWEGARGNIPPFPPVIKPQLTGAHSC